MWKTAARRAGPLSRFALSFALAACALAGPAAAAGFETTAPTAILVDYDTGTVLLEKNADAPTPPASLTKLMTVEVVFHELQQGRIGLDDMFTVSPNAWHKGGATSGGSTMFLPVNSKVSLRDLIQGIVIQSGNDATIVVAEGLAGSEDNFAALMNRRAQEIGLTQSHFTNPHGLPDPAERVTMRDLATLAAHLIRTYPDQYKYFGETSFTYNGITQANRNPTIGLVDGADGLKTGHTAESGYGLVASAERDGRRLILAMNGLKSSSERAREARKLLEWGFRGFEQTTLVPKGKVVGQVEVVGGERDAVPVTGGTAIRVVALRGGGDAFETKIVTAAPVEAPVEKGERVGTLQIVKAGSVVREVPLVAAEPIARGSWLHRAWQATANLVESHL